MSHEVNVVDLWQWLRERWPYTGIVAAHDERTAAQVHLDSEVKMTQDEDIELPGATPIRRLQPGDALDVVIKLRKLLSMIDTTSYTLYASFEDLGSEDLDIEASKARHTLELAASRMNSLLTTIEKTPAYTKMRKETLARRRDRSSQGAKER